MKPIRFLLSLLLLAGALCLQARETRSPLSADGPYVLYTDAGVRVIAVDASGTVSDTVSPEPPASFTVIDHRGRNPFEVSLRPIRRQNWCDRTRPDRVFVMSDPHGRLDCVLSLLLGNMVIDKELHWSFGKSHLVMIGDVFDRGEDVVQIFWFFYRLQQEAEEAGGRVTMLLGNHEPMAFSGDMRYAKPKYAALAERLGMEYRELFGPASELGRWIASWNTVGIVGHDLFVHAGLGADFYRWNLPVETVNRRMSDVIFLKNKERKALSDTLDFLYGSYGPIWFRGLVLDEETRRPVPADTLDLLLDRYGVDHIIVGHTIFKDISTFYDGKVITVNVDNRVNRRKHRGRALLIEGDRYVVVGDRGKKRELK